MLGYGLRFWLNVIAPFIGLAMITWAFFQIDSARKISETGFNDFYTFVSFLIVLIVLFAVTAFINVSRNNKLH